MLALPDVAQAVAHACVFNQAAATGGDARQLVGYVVSESGLPLDRDALLASLEAQLPPHMVPVVLLQISALPLSANGKLDRKALPLPDLTSKTSGRAPETQTEVAVAQAFLPAGLRGERYRGRFLCPRRPLAAGDAPRGSAQPCVQP
ncbi:AMP-binding enzyme [Enterobacter hormaechei]